MKILLTGGTGFVGAALTKQLARLDHNCTVLTRTPRAPQPNIQYITWDTVDADQLQQLMDTHHAVINLAGETVGGGRWTAQRKAAMRNSRISITEQIVNAIKAAQTPPQVLINASAIGWYPSSPLVQDEDTPAGDHFLARMVHDWEQCTERAAKHCRVVTLRISLVLGPQGGPLHRLAPLFRWGLGGRIGDGQQWMSWIHRDDLIHMIITALDDPAWYGPMNAVSPAPVTNTEFTKALSRIVQRPAFFHVPSWGMRLLLGEMADLVLTSHRIHSHHPALNNFTCRYTNIEDAIKASI